jgi:hypothetical protein
MDGSRRARFSRGAKREQAGVTSPSEFVRDLDAAIERTIIVLTIQHLGLLAAMVLFLVNFIISNAIVTFDPSKWFFGDSMLLMMIPAALACYGFYISRDGEPLLGRRLLD